MDCTPRSLFLLLLGCAPLLSPAFLLADLQETPSDTNKRRLQVFVQGPTEGTKTGVAKSEWQRLRILALSRRLDRDLENFESASQWQSFLRVPQDILLLKNTGRQNRGTHSLNKSLQRFAQIAENKQHEAIASLNSFQAMHNALQRYASSRKSESQIQESYFIERPEHELNQVDDSKHQRVSNLTIVRLPPVLALGEQPDLLPPPDQNKVH
ncbi:MAG: hypothetical protein VXZ84_12115 [Planctomycetota bacterium]|nr:hypothetical protein [Planctomycetota bacterium]